jgi:hypothetical protein
MSERFSNYAVTTTTALIDGVTDPVSITVDNASMFPDDGNFRVLIDSEIMLVTSVAGNSFTAVRAVEGTQITAHEPGSIIRHIFTAGALNTAFTESVKTGPINNLPSEARAGDMYICTDTVYSMVHDGTDWMYFVNGYKVTPPAPGDFTWVNQGTATMSSTYGGVLLADLTTAGGNYDLACIVRPTPTPPYSVVWGFYYFFEAQHFGLTGPILYDSGSGKIVLLRWGTGNNSVTEILYERMNSVSSPNNAAFVYGGDSFVAHPMFMKMTDDGSMRRYYIGPHPYFFPIEYYSISNTDFMIPDYYGFHVNAYNRKQNVHIIHFEEQT